MRLAALFTVILLTAVGLIAARPWPAAEAQFAYTRFIQRANLDGSAVESVIGGIDAARDMEIDDAAGKLYWADSGSIERANLDGTDRETVVAANAGFIALDIAHGKVYWSELLPDLTPTPTATATVSPKQLPPTGEGFDGSGVGQAMWFTVGLAAVGVAAVAAFGAIYIRNRRAAP